MTWWRQIPFEYGVCKMYVILLRFFYGTLLDVRQQVITGANV